MSERRSIEVAGLGHGANPIPAASRIGNVIMTGGVSGADPATNAFSAEPAQYFAQMFANLRAILAAAGASPDDIIKLVLTVRSFETREAINLEWIGMFPDPASRPARKVSRYDYLPEGMFAQCEAYAVIGAAK